MAEGPVTKTRRSRHRQNAPKMGWFMHKTLKPRARGYVPVIAKNVVTPRARGDIGKMNMRAETKRCHAARAGLHCGDSDRNKRCHAARGVTCTVLCNKRCHAARGVTSVARTTHPAKCGVGGSLKPFKEYTRRTPTLKYVVARPIALVEVLLPIEFADI